MNAKSMHHKHIEHGTQEIPETFHVLPVALEEVVTNTLGQSKAEQTRARARLHAAKARELKAARTKPVCGICGLPDCDKV